MLHHNYLPAYVPDYNYSEDFPEPPWDVVYTPQINRFNGAGTAQLRLQDVLSSPR